ncbi:M56 family metallopeptidase [Aequorivita marina]|uniref:M56 family metallopeptidase n=1 Tax=Aequorivita marina TaxID=3073654 RepID=UPI002875E6B5|nr:M56 family metallopeptidase [Aequorivita sp. S2608]MDS1299745.1 M56 family metallopeptidase [Aequorivita sp. S2608]
MIHTILQILVFQFLFLAVYDLFLKKETFFTLNRIYLLAAPVLGFALPFLSFGFIQQNIPQEYVFQLPTLVIGNTAAENISGEASYWLPSLLGVWTLGVVISTALFGWKLYKLHKLRSVGALYKQDGSKLIILPKTKAAFSFSKTIYLGENISEESRASIIAHEKVHLQQKHTYDLIFFEMLRIVCWFNPFIYLFQSRMTTLHEFIADAKIALSKDKKQYYQNLLSEVFQTEEISFINTFFKQSLIKKRVIMLQKSKSRKIKLMKYLLLLPILGGMLIYTSCSDNAENLQEQQQVSDEIPPPPPPPAPPEHKGDVDIPFAAIEKVPTYPGCSGDNETMKKCMSTKIAEFLNNNFNTELGKTLDLKGRQRIAVQFKIDKTGKVADVRARANHPKLEAEALRIVKMLPQMQPGEQKGEKVGVLYSLPIVFDVVE